MSMWQPYRLGMAFSKYIKNDCQLCRINQLSAKNGVGNYTLCQPCHNSILWQPKPHSILLENGQSLLVQAVTTYQHPISNIIKRFKTNHDMSVLPILTYMLEQLPIPIIDVHTSIIIPMPTTNSRLVERGFDPVWLLANRLSTQWQIPLWQNIAMRDTEHSQKSLTKNERAINMQDVFTITSSLPKSTTTIVLFDDISTTGASLKSLAETIVKQTDTHVQIYAFCLAH